MGQRQVRPSQQCWPDEVVPRRFEPKRCRCGTSRRECSGYARESQQGHRSRVLHTLLSPRYPRAHGLHSLAARRSIANLGVYAKPRVQLGRSSQHRRSAARKRQSLRHANGRRLGSQKPARLHSTSGGDCQGHARQTDQTHVEPRRGHPARPLPPSQLGQSSRQHSSRRQTGGPSHPRQRTFHFFSAAAYAAAKRRGPTSCCLIQRSPLRHPPLLGGLCPTQCPCACGFLAHRGSLAKPVCAGVFSG